MYLKVTIIVQGKWCGGWLGVILYNLSDAGCMLIIKYRWVSGGLNRYCCCSFHALVTGDCTLCRFGRGVELERLLSWLNIGYRCLE